jgi:hypothetical protein
MAFETEFDRASMVLQNNVASGWDFATLFSDAAIPFVYKNKGTRYNLKGIFDHAYQGVEIAESEFASEQPMIMLPTSALPVQPVVGDKVVIECEVYIVVNFKPDGTGVTTLMLEATTDLDDPNA